MLANMAVGIEAGRMLTYKAATEIDAGRNNTMYASMAKVFAAEHCNKVVTDAVQIFGGAGFNTECVVCANCQTLGLWFCSPSSRHCLQVPCGKVVPRCQDLPGLLATHVETPDGCFALLQARPGDGRFTTACVCVFLLYWQYTLRFTKEPAKFRG